MNETTDWIEDLKIGRLEDSEIMFDNRFSILELLNLRILESNLCLSVVNFLIKKLTFSVNYKHYWKEKTKYLT